jgi:hypothetical protein
MKCAYYQKQKKNKLSTESRKHLQKIVNNFMETSMVVGVDNALDIMREETEQKEEEN